MPGRIAGVARRAAPKAAMEVIERANISFAGGVEGDFRGALKGAPYRRQISLLEAGDWAAAMDELGLAIPWQERRANLLVADFDLPQMAGVRIAIGENIVLETTIETDPCHRMEALAGGLQAALTPNWRGGLCAFVVAEGEVRVGDSIRILANQDFA